MFRNILTTGIFICACLSFGFGQTGTPTSKVNARPSPTPSAPAAEPFDKADVKTMAAQCVSLDTDAGLIELELYPEHAPESVRNFLNLTATGLFDGTSFSRVVPGFVIQGGNMWSREGGKGHACLLANAHVGHFPMNRTRSFTSAELSRWRDPMNRTRRRRTFSFSSRLHRF
jgi:hypothetical protein